MDAKSTSGGTGFWGLLALVFITLKLLGKIDWSWWWVLSPIWGGLAVVLLLVAALVVAAVVAKWMDKD